MAFGVLSAVLLSVFCALYVIRRRFFRNGVSRLPPPPGPKPRFLLGNLYDIPKHTAWLTYARWKEEYGDVIHLKAMGKTLIVLNTLKTSTDLLEKRSAKYSDRPALVMIPELLGWNYFMTFMRYSVRWRAQRRTFYKAFNENAISKYRMTQIRSAHTLARRLLHDPEGLFDHLRFAFGDSLIDTMYGIRVEDHNDHYINDAERTIRLLVDFTNGGLYMVDVFPFLKHIPSWLPGARFKREAALYRPLSEKLKTDPFDHVQRDLKRGVARPSVLLDMLEDSVGNPTKDGSDQIADSPEEIAKNTAAVGYTAGADTTVFTVCAFFLAMAMYPEVQEAAQKELQNVVGDNRLPAFDDAKRLPYIRAIIKETIRWHNVAPLGFVHCSTEDDEYNGYYIPKGAMCFANIWAILHDPAVFPEPQTFNPARWLVETPEGTVFRQDLPDSEHVGFGFGRRGCPGKHFALEWIFITIATVLTCFEISPPLDDSGKPVKLEYECTDGFLSNVTPFRVLLRPRTSRVAELVRETEFV